MTLDTTETRVLPSARGSTHTSEAVDQGFDFGDQNAASFAFVAAST